VDDPADGGDQQRGDHAAGHVADGKPDLGFPLGVQGQAGDDGGGRDQPGRDQQEIGQHAELALWRSGLRGPALFVGGGDGLVVERP
jgi:hypothetical protein